MKPRIEVARSDIEQVVHAFYARVRAHPVLAQVFARHVDDWPAHEEKDHTILGKCTFVRRRLRWEPNAGAYAGAKCETCPF